jgi:hypothetical protein
MLRKKAAKPGNQADCNWKRSKPVVIDLSYVAKRRISPVYLLDALAAVAFALSWASKLRGRR